jgi:hypothetical protein
MADGIGRIIRCMSYLRRVRSLAWILVAAGVGLLALSFVLDPTPVTYTTVHLSGGTQRVPVTHDHAVDYVISASRIAGVALLIAGAYLGYRSYRPDAVVVDDTLPPSGYDKYANVSPIHGDPSSRSGIG